MQGSTNALMLLRYIFSGMKITPSNKPVINVYFIYDMGKEL